MQRISAISVVICAYTDQRWDDLVAAIASVRGQTLRPLEILVVIDHNPTLLERVRRLLPDVIALANSGARGLSAARNSGLARARGAIVAFIDDDAVAAPDWLAQLETWYAHDRIVGVGGPVRPSWLAGRPRWFPAEFDWVVGCTFRGSPTTAAPVQRLIGCNMSFRREVLEAVGGFRTGLGRVGAYPIAGEETELSIKVGQRWPTRQILYDPQVTVDHRVPATRATFAYFRTRCYCEGLSKALMTDAVGARDGLAAERSYITRTLPRGVLQGLADAARGDLAGLARAGAILAGLALTVYGYAQQRAAQLLWRGSRLTAPKARP